MPKQYTFKTTRYTGELETFLDSLPTKDRSRIIREMLILAMTMNPVGQRSFECGAEVRQMSPPRPTEDTQRSFECQTNEIHQEEEPDIKMVGDVSINLDDILDSQF